MSEPIRGRGASANIRNRFESIDYEDDFEHGAPEASTPGTVFLRDESKSIIARNESPDVGFDASINPYRGCEHGCVYCYARPSHEYLGFSAGLDFETRIMVKERAPDLLRDALHNPNWTPQLLAVSGVTDAYQPIEKRLGITRACLEVLSEYRNPVLIITKNRLVTRDIDVLQRLAAHDAVAVFVSMTTLDLGLNRVLEPRTSSPNQRLAAIRALAEAGIPVGTIIGPVIPGLNDNEIPNILEAVAEHGGRYARYIALRLPFAVAPLFERWLEEHFPARKEKILNRVRSMRGGKLYDSTYRKRMMGEGAFAEQIQRIFAVACNKHGVANAFPHLSVEAFRRPPRGGDQLALFR